MNQLRRDVEPLCEQRFSRHSTHDTAKRELGDAVDNACESQLTPWSGVGNVALEATMQGRRLNWTTTWLSLVTVSALNLCAAEIAREFQPTRVTITNWGKAEQVFVFSNLHSSAGLILGRNMQFSSVLGRRVTFIEADGKRRAFDVEQIHPSSLAALAVDIEQAKSKAARNDAVWANHEKAALIQLDLQRAERERKQAEEAAARAEAATQAEAAREQRLQQEAEFQRNQAAQAAAVQIAPPTQSNRRMRRY